jgi:N6-adenosine-specific RNA methylase IME4
MKHSLLTFLIALTATFSSNAQTLQVDPIYIGGTAAFEVQGGTPGGVAIVCYSINGTGPFTLANGLSLDLSMPIRQLSPMVLNGIGDGSLGPFPTPSSAIVGMQVWFQAVDVNIWGSQILSATNMVPIVVQNIPNNPPTAVDDNATVFINGVASIDVLANDGDPDGDAISIVAVNAPTNGTALIVSGQIEYTPFAGYVGVDSFAYVIEDVFAAQATATVFVDVAAGSLVSWGYDGYNQVGNTPTTNGFIQVAGGANCSVALKSDGTLVSWGYDGYNQVGNTPATNGFIQISAGGRHCVALRSDGSLVAWGYDDWDQVTNTPPGNDFTQVSAGGATSVALKSDGSLKSWGWDGEDQVGHTPTTNDFTQVSAGGAHSVALKSDGSLESWGSNGYNQVGHTPTTNDFAQVSAGEYHSVALKSDGSLESWGHDTSGQVSNTPTTNDFTQVSAGKHYSVALRSDGSLVSWGDNSDGQVSNIPITNDFAQVSAGDHHSVALKF